MAGPWQRTDSTDERRAWRVLAEDAGAGGPLGRGAAIIRLNSAAEGKKTKKYVIYGATVVDMQPTKNENKIFDSDKAEDVAKWVFQSHKPRFC